MSSLEVIGSRIIMFWRGSGDDRGIPSQLTAIRVDGVEAFVREGLKTRSIDHFVMSSNARLGNKADHNRIPAAEILELAAPRAHWNAIAAAVAELDTLEREVRRNSRWSLETARDLWRSGHRRTHW